MGKVLLQDSTSNVLKLVLWTGLLLPPIAWAAVFEAVYLANEYACAGMSTTWSHVASAVGLILCGVGGACAYRSVPGNDPPAVEPVASQRLMSVLGIISSIFFGLTVVATWSPMLFGVPCSK